MRNKTEVIQAFLNGATYGRNGTYGNMSIASSTSDGVRMTILHSYDTPIAARFSDGALWLSQRRYSPTTSQHQGALAREATKAGYSRAGCTLTARTLRLDYGWNKHGLAPFMSYGFHEYTPAETLWTSPNGIWRIVKLSSHSDIPYMVTRNSWAHAFATMDALEHVYSPDVPDYVRNQLEAIRYENN